MKKIILSFLALLAISFSNAQETPISNTNVSVCQGFFVDTGLAASDYSANENMTMVLCSETNDVINLYFNVFSLGAGDTLSIYDGSDISAPLIGSFVDFDLSSQNVTSTNADGCLTVVWTSDAVEMGNFTAEISCEAPCFPPILSVTTNSDTSHVILACPGEELIFDASDTEFGTGALLGDFEWDFYDGTTDNTSWPIALHTFDNPGGYVISLSVTDDNGCGNTNVIDIIVLVSTYPELTLPTLSTYCLGEGAAILDDDVDIPVETEVFEYEIESVPFDFDFSGIDGGDFFIPDNQTTCFENSVEVSGFAPGSVIDDISLIENLFINFEHSFMGDITISFICPNNQSIAVHQINGGGTNLGVPSTGGGPGTGYDYWWAPDATNGTWEQESNGTSLPSGTYSSVQSFNSLLGCPINGVWTLEICDTWAGDDGYIFDWSIEFDESLYPNFIGESPIYGLDCDSTYLSSEFFTQGDDCSLNWTESITEAGDYPIYITTTNNFGCSFTEEMTLQVLENPIAEAGESQQYCDETPLIQLDGSASGVNGLLGPHIYEWSPAQFIEPGDISSFDPELTADAEGNLWYYFTVTPAFHPLCAHTDSVNIVIAPTVTPVITIEGGVAEICSNALINLSVNDDYSNYEWNGDSNLNTSTVALGPGSHTVIAYEDENCTVTTNVVISALPEVDFIDHSICNDLTFFVDDNFVNIDGDWSYSTTDGGELTFGSSVSNTQLIATSSGVYTVTFTDQCNISDEFDFIIGMAPSEDEFFIEPIFSICESDLPLTLQPVGANSDQYLWQWSDQSVSPSITTNAAGEFIYTVYNECGSDSDTTFVEIATEVDFVDHSICNSLELFIDDNTNNVTGTWSYTTSNGGSLVFNNPTASNSFATATQQGIYQVTFTDECNLSDVFEVSMLFAPSEEQFTINPLYTPCEDETPLVLQPEGSSFDLYQWSWSNGDNTTSTIIDESGEYTYTVSNACGSNEDTTYVNVLACDLIIPNIFTPNSIDTLNSSFVIDGLHFFPGSKLTIYNRWGNLIYQSQDYKNDWSPSKDETADGTYYYLLEVNREGDKVDGYTGYVQVLR